MSRYEASNPTAMVVGRVNTERPHSSPGGYLSHSDDLATSPALSLKELERFLDEIRYQPNWRYVADEEADYYDGNQLRQEMAAELEDRGLAPIIVNLIKPTIDLVLGMEARTRRDWIVRADTDDDQETAEALNVRLKDAERVCWADRARSDAYAAQTKVGLGWVEITRETDPFLPRFRCKYVHRREIWWDWRAKDPLLHDARYLVRKQWFDEDQVIATFPDHRELILHAVNGFTEWDYTQAQLDQLLVREWQNERDTSIDDMDWRDTERRRLALYEVWYKVWVRGYVMDLPGKRAIEYDHSNEKHQQIVAMGLVKPRVAVFTKIRLSWWIGPHRIIDVPNPFPFNRFPYVPFFGYREDRTGVPYGLVRSMKSPQDEFNARRRKLMWLLAARRVIADSDAVKNKDHEAVMQEVARPDSYIQLNENRQNKTSDAFRVEDGGRMVDQQFLVMGDAADRLQSSAGIFQEALGKSRTGDQSGVAIANLVEQSTTTLGEINDNYTLSSAQVGEMMLALEKEDLANEENVKVKIQHAGRTSRTVYLNRTTVDDQGFKSRTNDVTRLRGQVVLDDQPSTATFRQQQLKELAAIVKGLPEELQALVIDLVIEATDLPKDAKDEINKRLRKAVGIDEQPDLESMSKEERAAYEQEAAAAEEAAAEQKAVQDAAIAAALRKDNAEAERAEKQAFKAESDAERANQEALLEADARVSEATRKDRELDMKERELASETSFRASERDRADSDADRERQAGAESETQSKAATEAAAIDKAQDAAIAKLEKELIRITAEHKAMQAMQSKAASAPAPKAEPVPAPPAAPQNITIQVDATSGPVTKRVSVERDKAGRLVGATVREEEAVTQ